MEGKGERREEESISSEYLKQKFPCDCDVQHKHQCYHNRVLVGASECLVWKCILPAHDVLSSANTYM